MFWAVTKKIDGRQGRSELQTHMSLVAGWNSVDVSSAGIFVEPGVQFTIGIQGADEEPSPPPYFQGTYLDAYAGGRIYNSVLDPDVGSRSDLDMSFRT